MVVLFLPLILLLVVDEVLVVVVVVVLDVFLILPLLVLEEVLVVIILVENHTKKARNKFVKSNVFNNISQQFFLCFSYSDLYVILELMNPKINALCKKQK